MVEKKKEKKPSSLIHFLALLILFLACLLLLLLSLAAAPLSRDLALRSQSSPVPEVSDQVMKGGAGELIARMELESDDYPGSGANNRHDPKSPPGRA